MSFPTDIDTLTDVTDGVDYPQATHINTLNQAVEALEAKVGADSSAVASSIDFKLANITSGHDHDGSDSKKVIATNLNPTGLTASQLLRVNSGGTAIESAGYTVATLMSAVWPVGSVYTNITGVNPGTELGFGTWSQIAGGKVLIGQSSGDADFDTAEETGGAKTATLAVANLPAHDHTGSTIGNESAHTHSIDPPSTTSGNQSASHTHSVGFEATGVVDGNQGYGLSKVSGYANNVGVTNGSRNTGTESASHTHSVNISAFDSAAGSSHTHTLTIASQGSGTAFSIMNPYFIVFFYKRVS